MLSGIDIWLQEQGLSAKWRLQMFIYKLLKALRYFNQSFSLYIYFSFQFITHIFYFTNSNFFLFQHMTDISRAQKLLTNMRDSPSTEVRKGAFNTLYSKISCKLIFLDEICSLNPECAATMLYWIQDFYCQVSDDTLLSALQILTEMAKHESTKRRMRQSSTPAQFLSELREWAQQNKRLLKLIDECLENLVDFAKDAKETQSLTPLQVKNKSMTPLQVKNSTTNRKQASESVRESKCESKYFSASRQQETQQVQIIEKPDETKCEFVYLPQVKLLEVDEKILFDSQIQLKFGNNQTVLQTLRDVVPNILRNFPIEILRQKYELVQELIAIAQSHQKEDNIVYYGCRCLLKIIRKIRKRVRVDERWINIQNDKETFKSDPRESIKCSYPSLEPGEVQRIDGQKSLKLIVTNIGIGMLEQSERFLGMKIKILNEIKELLVELKDRCEIEDMCIKIGIKIGQFLDRQECSISIQRYAPLFILGGEYLNQVQNECEDLKSICNYLSQAQFSYMLSREQSQQLLNKISLFDQNILVQSGRVESILNSVNLLWSKNNLLENNELIILCQQELEDTIKIQRELLLAIPIANNLRFIKHYIQSYLYALDDENNEHLLIDCQDNFIQMIYNPCRNSKIICYQTILQYLNDYSQLKKAKKSKREGEYRINELMLMMLSNKKILYNLYQNSVNDDELYGLMVDILMNLIKQNKMDYEMLYTSIISRNVDDKSNVLIQLLCNSDKQINDLYDLMNIFNKNEHIRKSSYNKLIQWKSYQPFIQNNIKIDPLDEFLDSNKSKFNYQDQLDDQINMLNIFNNNNKNSTINTNISIEQISNLETLIIDEQEWHLKSAALQQLIDIYVMYLYNNKQFIKLLQVKLNQIADYWQSISTNLLNLLYKLPYAQCVSTAFLNFIAHLFDFIAITNMPFDYKFVDILVYFLTQVDITRQLKYSTLRLLYVLVFNYQTQSNSYPQIQPNHSSYFTFWDKKIINQKQISYIETWSLYYPLSKNVQWYITQYVQHLKCGLSYDQYQQQYYTIEENIDIAQKIDQYISYSTLGIKCKWTHMIQQIQSLILNHSFIGSQQMYLLNLLIHIIPNNHKVWTEFNQQISLLLNEQSDNVDIIALQLQVAYLIQKYPSSKSPIIVQTYNEKQLLYLTKLSLKSIIQPNQIVINYISKHVLTQQHHLNFTNSYYLKKYLIILIKHHIDPFYFIDDPLDRQVLFSQILHLISNHISHIRLLALTLLHSSINSLNNEQKQRLTEILQEIILLPSESQAVYSIATILYQSYPNPPLPKLITNLHASITTNPTKLNPLPLSASISLLSHWVESEHRIDTLQAIYSTGLDQILSSLLKIKPTSINHCYLIANTSQIIVSLMRQSLSASLALLQATPLIELVVCQLHRLSKKCDCEQAPLQCSAILQLACAYHRDYVCVSLRKHKRNPFKSLLTLLQMDIKDKMPLAKTVQLILSTGYECDDQDAGELVLTLNSLDKNDLDLVATVTSLVGVSQSAKVNFIRCDENKYLNEMNKELDLLLLEDTNNKKQMTQSLNQSFGATGDKKLQIYANFLANMHGVEDKSFMSGLVQILSKLLQLSLKYSPLIDCFKTILINHCSNASNAFIAKMSESKQNLIVEMIKHAKLDQILECLSVVGQHNDLRLVIYRTKLFQDLNEKLNQMWQNSRKWNPSNRLAIEISKFFAALSFYKDAHTKILNNSATMDLFVTLIIDHGCEHELCKNFLLAMSNCATNSKTKMFYMGNQRFQALIMSLISEEQNDLKIRVESCQLLINLFYKSTKSISSFNMEEVIEELSYWMKQSARSIEKCRNENVLVQEKERQEMKIKYLQQLQNQLNQILRILKIEW